MEGILSEGRRRGAFAHKTGQQLKRRYFNRSGNSSGNNRMVFRGWIDSYKRNVILIESISKF